MLASNETFASELSATSKQLQQLRLAPIGPRSSQLRSVSGDSGCAAVNAATGPPQRLLFDQRADALRPMI